MIHPKRTKDIRQMFWTCFQEIRRSKLYNLERDERSPRRGYTSWSLICVLKKALRKHATSFEIFQQDNAGIHTSRKVRKVLQDLEIATMVWPSYFPDLNPIEHAWRRFKDRVVTKHPHLSDMGDSEEAREALINACKKEWKKLAKWFFKRLVESMPRRLAAVRAARGWNTKY